VVGPDFQGPWDFEELHVHTDGAARGNPGPAAIGVVIGTPDGRGVARFGLYIGETTNNYAEYTALVHALRLLSSFNLARLRVFSDSDLMVQQLKGNYRVKEPHLKSLYAQVTSMLGRYRDWHVDHVPREENREADELANQALDDYERGARRVRPPQPPQSPRKPQTSLFE
jgi:ribonuclease HI